MYWFICIHIHYILLSMYLCTYIYLYILHTYIYIYNIYIILYYINLSLPPTFGNGVARLAIAADRPPASPNQLMRRKPGDGSTGPWGRNMLLGPKTKTSPWPLSFGRDVFSTKKTHWGVGGDFLPTMAWCFGPLSIPWMILQVNGTLFFGRVDQI